ADFVVNAKTEDATKAVMDHTNGLGADIVYESVGGVATTMETAQEVVRPGGVISVIGSFRTSPALDFRRLLRYEIDVRFAWSYAMWNGVPEFKISIDMLADGRVRAEPIITHRFALDDIQEAFDACLDRYASDAIKVVINP
ncbi:MAG: zinc-binding dehydrogenase, partial [Candidatus Poribacteria bacterium]